MINKKELLEQLQQYDYFVVDNVVDLTTGTKRGICQTSIYDNVKFHWNGKAFKFWNEKCEDVSLFLDSNIENAEFEKDILTLHIDDCPEVMKIRCRRRM